MTKADQDFSSARRAIAAGDLSEATDRLLAAVAGSPSHEEIPSVVEAWLDAAGDGAEALLPQEEEGLRFEAAVLLAFVLHRGGDLAGALHFLLHTMGARDGADFAPTALAWAAPEVLAAADPERLTEACALDTEGPAAELRDTLLERIHTAHPLFSRLALKRARYLRMAGDLEAALTVAEEQHQRHPDYWACISLGTNRKESGDLPGAVAAFEEALEHESEDVGSRLELGDLYIDMANWSLARDRYREVLELPADDTWARPSWLFAELRLTGDAAWEKKLLDYARQEPENARAEELLGLAKTYRYFLPTRPEATIALVTSGWEDDPIESIGLSSMEAPSATLAVREAVGEELDIAFEVPDPDPRVPIREVPFTLWRYQRERHPGPERGKLGVTPEPGLPAPKARVATAVRSLAESDYELAAWSRKARRYAEKLDVESMRHVLATMVHPPASPGLYTPWDWRFRVQVAAALIVAHMGDANFPSSSAATAFSTILDGPVDWTITATIVALMDVALRDAGSRAGVIQRLTKLLRRPTTPIWFMCAIEPTVHCLLQIPGLDPELHARLLETRDDLERI